MRKSTSISHPVIVCAADDRYSLPLAVMLYSAARNYKGLYDLEVYILDAGISAAHKKKIRGVLAPFHIDLHWLTPSQTDLLKGVPITDTWGIASYYRLLIPDLLPATVNKTIYLDCDILVETDLSRLWQQDVADHYLLAVQDTGRKTKTIANSSLAKWTDLEFSEDDQYFNSGVLVMNVSLMRKENFGQRALDFVRRWPTRFADQDGLNAVSIGRWGKLEPSFNVFVSRKRPEFKYRSESVLHYLDPKPWIPTQNKGYERSEIGKAHDAYNKYMYQSGWFNPPEWLWHSMSCTLFRYFGGPLQAIRRIAHGMFEKTK